MPSLPSVIDPKLASKCFIKHHNDMKGLIKHCLITVAGKLYSEVMIPEDVYEVCIESGTKNEKAATLLNSVKADIGTNFAKFVEILRSEPYLESLADKLVTSYLGNSLAYSCRYLLGEIPVLLYGSRQLHSYYLDTIPC